ncbi:hypothetical protein C8R46DRAFT_441899 [Mycena filopes]|nr:hypothetical protein C8R46DRAFT_441899 [Mycena filopes]
MRTCLARLALLSAAVSVVSAGEQTSDKETPEPCKVRAWVRAEDLSPAHISHGELRVKALRPECAHQIASVALRLQFDEIGEVKFVKNSAVIPELQLANQTDPVGYEDYMGSDFALNHQTHDDAMSNPALWTVKAEERRGWTTEATLLHHPDLSNPIVTPFTVAVPAVNYPPVVDQYRYLRGPVARYSSSDIGYRYISVVKFA